MTTNTPPQDSDAEIDELLHNLWNRASIHTKQTGRTVDYEIAEARQAIQALQKRWEVEARIEERKKVVVNSGTITDDLHIHVGKDYIYYQQENEHIDRIHELEAELAALQNQLPSK